MAKVKERTWTTKQGETRSAWIADYRDQQGVRRLKTFERKKDADAWLDQAKMEVRQGTHTPASSSKTVAEAFDLWIDECAANGLVFSTIRQRRQHLEHHVKPFIGGTKLASLTTPGLYAFDKALREAGRSRAMRQKVMTSVGSALSFAQGRGYVAQNVARGVRIRRDERESAKGPLRPGVDFPTVAEINALIDNSTGRLRPFVIVAVFTGMRLGELRGLRWSDVDLDAGVIHVRQRVDQWGTMGAPKTKAGKRDIPLAPIVVNTLRVWRLSCPKGELDLVFPTKDGKPQNMGNFHTHAWYPLLARCGVDYNFHMLRHAAASLFIAHLGWQPKRIQTVMGHGSIKMTFDLYGHLFESKDADREDMKRLEAAVRIA
jgi:integrase